MDIEWSRFWWNEITGARFIVNEVTEALLDNKTAVLNVPYDLPWRHDMRAAIEQTYRPNADTENIIIYQIDDTDERELGLSVGRFLLQKFGQKREVKSNYRERAGKTIQEYLIDNAVLRERILWIKGLSIECAKEWISFAEGYNSKSAQDGLFVLEVPGDLDGVLSDSIKNVIYNNYVTEYDVQLLNSFILGSKEELPEEWKQYISNVSAKLCQTDAEASEWLVNNVNFRRMDPVEAIGRLSTVSEFCNRGRMKNSDHVLALYRTDKKPVLRRRVWASQIRTLFPIIEMEKHNIIEKYYNVIKEALDFEEFKQYEKLVKDPYDLEIGGLYYLTTHKGVTGMYRVYIEDEKVREKIKFLRDCRNTLAHESCCKPEEVDRIIMGKL